MLAGVVLLSVLLAGCGAPSRDIEQEGADRQAFAKKNNDHDVVAVLSGPARVQPGALVWYSAYGSHDPDFLGATTRDLYGNDTAAQGGVHYTDESGEVRFNWYGALHERRNQALGTGVRVYEWQVDDGAVLRSFDLTHRYGSEDGPIRFPLGFVAAGEHAVRLTVIGWDGSRDTQHATVTVADDGVASQLSGWSTTSAGWTYARDVEVGPEDYGECLSPLAAYDEPTHRVGAPWDLVYFMERVVVNATWPPAAEQLGLPVPGVPALNTNQVDVTLGHCARDGAWARFAADQEFLAERPEIVGEVGGGDFASKLEATGLRTEKTGAWDFNAYLSDEGQARGGTGATVRVQFAFVPATDTSAGAV